MPKPKPKPKTKDFTRNGTEITVQRVKMQMRDASGRDTSPESYGGDTIEDGAQYIAERTADSVRETGGTIKDKAVERLKERTTERVRRREDGPDAQKPNSGHTAPQEPQTNRSYTESQHDGPARPQDRPVEAAPDSHDGRTPRQRPNDAERIKSRDKVKRVLENDRYLGTDGYPAVLDQQTVNKARSFRYYAQVNRNCHPSVHLLKSKTVCAKCGSKMIRDVQRNRRQPVGWVCQGCGAMLALPDDALLGAYYKRIEN